MVGGNDSNDLTQGRRQSVAWIYTRSKRVWTLQESKIIGTPFSSKYFNGGNYSVSLSADGNTSIMTGNSGSNTECDGAWVFNGTRQVLPITLSNYEALLYQNNAVKILWSTASEHNNNYFELFKSTDGVNFQTIANIKSLGNSNSLQRYNFVDKFPANGNNYYKLVQTDLDGTRKEIGLKTVKFELENAAQISLYPNPVSNILNIGFGDGNYNTLEITDLLGRIILTKSINVKDKESTVNVAQLSQATYIINLRGKSGSISKQFVKN